MQDRLRLLAQRYLGTELYRRKEMPRSATSPSPVDSGDEWVITIGARGFLLPSELSGLWSIRKLWILSDCLPVWASCRRMQPAISSPRRPFKRVESEWTPAAVGYIYWVRVRTARGAPRKKENFQYPIYPPISR